MRPDWGLLKDAYLLPIRRWRDALACFWPAMAVYVAAYVLPRFSSADFISDLGGLALLGLHWLVLVVCAVRWHRLLVLDERVGTIWWPISSNAQSYALRALAVSLAFVFASTLAHMIGIPLWYPMMDPQANDAMTRLNLHISVEWLVAEALVSLLLARVIALLPVFAVEPVATAWKARRRWSGPKAGWRSTLLMGTLPATAVIWLALPLSLWALGLYSSENPIVVAVDDTATALLILYGALVFLTTLSLWHMRKEREDLLRQVQQVPTQ